MILHKSPSTNLYLIPQPKTAWSAILVLIFSTIICLLIGISSILQFLFPLGAFVVGAFLYKKYPILYIGFTWWIWFIAPLVARIVEYQNGWGNPNLRLIIVSPYLVTMLAGITFMRYIPRTYQKDGLPFLLAFIAISYACATGLIRKSSATVVIEGLLSWMPAIFLGFHFIIHWRNYPQYKQIIQRSFCWGMLIMGIYGIAQYFSLPPWDQFWLDNSEEVRRAIGWENIRIWSTFNLPIGFTNFLIASLLLTVSSKDKLKIPSGILGLLCLLIARVRSSWFGFLVGLTSTIISLKPNIQIKFISTILTMILCFYPLLLIEPIYDGIAPRIQTLFDLQGDHSISERLELYGEKKDRVLTNIVGSGLGTKLTDTGSLEILDTLGWVGFIPYGGGILLLCFKSFRFIEAKFDPFINASRSISLSILAMSLGNNMFVRFYSVMFWGFMGITFAAHKYYQYQNFKKAKKNQKRLS